MADSQPAQQQSKAGLSPVHICILGFLAWRYFFADSDDKHMKKESSQGKPIVIKQEFNVFDDPRYLSESPLLSKRIIEPDEFEAEDGEPTLKTKGRAEEPVLDYDVSGEDLDDLKDVNVLIRFDQNSEYVTESVFELKKFLEVNYPQTIGNIIGVYAPLPPWVLGLSSAVGVLQMGGLFLGLAGKKVLGEDSSLVKLIHNNKMKCFMLIMGLNLLTGTFQWTGIFDIEVNGELIFSKSAEERFPTGQELVDMLYERGINPKRKNQKIQQEKSP